MDGASKFVKGDAIAAIVITLINLIGGFAIGMLQKGLSPAEAIQKYSLLTVGDGLVSQIPALLLSVSTGLIVTRSATDGDMGSNVAQQLGQHKVALRIAGGAALALCAIPGLPKIPFLIVGATVLVIAQRIPTVRPEDEAAAAGGRRRAGRRRHRDARSARCASTRSNWPSPRTWWIWSTAPAATCSTGYGRCAARSRSTWAS